MALHLCLLENVELNTHPRSKMPIDFRDFYSRWPPRHVGTVATLGLPGASVACALPVWISCPGLFGTNRVEEKTYGLRVLAVRLRTLPVFGKFEPIRQCPCAALKSGTLWTVADGVL